MRAVLLLALLVAAARAESLAPGAWAARVDLAQWRNGARVEGAATKGGPMDGAWALCGDGIDPDHGSWEPADHVVARDVVIELARVVPPPRFDTVALTQSGYDPPSRPREVEVLAAEDAGVFRTLGTLSLPRDDGTYALTVPPTRAARVMLRVRTNHGGAALQLGRVRILEAPEPGRALADVGRARPLADAADDRADVAAAALGGSRTGEAGQKLPARVTFALAGAAPRVSGITLEQAASVDEGYRPCEIDISTSMESMERGFTPARTVLVPREPGVYACDLAPAAARFVRLDIRTVHGGHLTDQVSMGRVRVLAEAAGAVPADRLARPESPAELDGRLNLLGYELGARVVRAAPEVGDVEIRGADALVRVRDDRFGWWPPRDPAPEAILALGGSAPVTLDTLAFQHYRDPARHVPALAPPSTRARLVRIAHATAEQGPWTELGTVVLDASHARQVLAVPPFAARFLKVGLVAGGGGAECALGRVEAYAPASAAPDTARLPRNLLPFEHGGNLVRTEHAQEYTEYLTRVAGDDYLYPAFGSADRTDLVWAFRGFQPAHLGRLVLTPYQEGKSASYRLPREVEVLASAAGPLGPWTSVRRCTTTTAPGDQAFPLGGATARFVALRLFRAVEGTTTVKQISLEEEAGAPSIFARDFREDEPGRAPGGTSPAAGPADEREDNGDAGHACPLDWKVPRIARIEPPSDVDCFRCENPSDAAFQVTVGQEPIVRVDLTVLDAAGKTVAHASPGELTAARGVLRLPPGRGGYTLRVVQPPSAVLMLFDTSESLEPSRALIKQAAARFLEAAGTGEEVATALLAKGDAGPLDLIADFTPRPASIREQTLKRLDERCGSDQLGGVESGLALLAKRPSNRSLIVLTDGAPSSSRSPADAWSAVAAAGARIDVVGTAIKFENQFVRDWGNTQENMLKNLAWATGGRYVYSPSGEALVELYQEVQRSLRSNPPYRIQVGPLPAPGRLELRFQAPAVERKVRPARSILVVLDLSGSMKESIAGGRKIDIARRVLRQLVEELPDGTLIGLRVYGHRYGPKDPRTCEDMELVLPLAPLDRSSFLASVDRLEPRGETPMIRSAVLAAGDLAQAPAGEKLVVLITDGIETCGGKPSDLDAITGAGVGLVKVNVVGFGIGDPRERDQLRQVAAHGHGAYFDAGDAASLTAALTDLGRAAFTVFGPGDTPLATGTVNGPAVALPEGRYAVRLDVTPPVRLESVSITSGETARIELTTSSDGSVKLLGP